VLRLLAPVVLIFKAWMFVDAIRRGANNHWIWAILFLPLGDVAYFFVVKMRDPGMRHVADRMLEGFKRPPPVEELEARYRTTPSIANRVALAQGLFDAGRFAESAEHFEELLARDQANKEALYGVGLCRLELDDAAGAVEPLSRLIELHRAYRDYAAWAGLCEALWKKGDEEECLELLVDLVRTAPRLRHQVLRARYLARAGRGADAQELLRAELADHDRQPRGQRSRDREWARAAQKLLDELEGPAPEAAPSVSAP
jgi:hypothetical protein